MLKSFYLMLVSCFSILKKLMAKRSDLSWKWPIAWQKRSHSMHATKRWFKPNIIRKWIELDWVKLRIKMTAKEYKKLRKEGAL